MSLLVADLLHLDVAAVQQVQAKLTAMVQEADPTIDVKRGVLHDLLLYFEALLAAATQTNIDRYNQARSLLEIEADPTLADPDIVDSVLSFYRITRREGTQAAGQITLIMSRQTTFTLPAGALFTSRGQSFAVDAVYTMQDSQALVIGPNDRYLVPLDDGTFAATINVTAVAPSTAGRLSKNSLLVPNDAIGGFVKAYAVSDFVGGSDTETNAQLIERLLSGVAAKCLSNRINMDALLQEQFPTIVADSIIGMGDPEMLRDRHWIWPTGGGGRIDWYVRTQEPVQNKTLNKTATMIESTSEGTVWQFTIERDEAPGLYDVVQVLRASSPPALGSYLILTDVRSTDVSDVATPPDMQTTAESAYSRYQTATITFLDTDNNAGLAVGTTRDYAVTVRYLPLIDAIQDYMSGRRVRHAAADVLVKAPVPCFVSLSFTIERRSTDPVPDVNAIAVELSRIVNTYGFTGRLPASVLADTVHNFLSGSTALSAIDMYGSIRRPNGTYKPLRSTEVLLIPDEADDLVTPRTTAFFLDPAAIAIAVQVANIPLI